MGILKKTAAVMISGLVIGTACVPAWSATANDPAPVNAQVMPADASGGSLLGILNSALTDTPRHEPQKDCKSPSLYSQHDVVGDPEACFLGRVNVPTGSVAPASIR
jgi:hypothetical protein